MNINELTTLISNNGLGVVCLGFTLYTYFTVLQNNQKTLDSIEKLMQRLLDKIDRLEKGD